MRKELLFQYWGKSLSPLFGFMMQTADVKASIQATTISPHGVASLVRATGSSQSIGHIRERIREANHARAGRIVTLVDAQQALAFFDYCPTPDDGSVSVEQIALQILGPAIRYESSIAGGRCTVRVVAGPDAPLSEFFKAARAALSARFEVQLLRTGSIKGDGSRDALTHEQETILLHALAQGFFEEKRATNVRDLSQRIGRSKSNIEDLLRAATRRIVERHLEWLRQTGSDEDGTHVSFEFWGAMPRSPHYACFMRLPELSAHIESLNITKDEAWQVVRATGPPDAIAQLRAAIRPPHPAPIEALTILQDTPGELIFYDRWRRPVDDNEGISTEHLLYDHCGHAGTLRFTFRHGVGRVIGIGPEPCIEAFARDAMIALGARYSTARNIDVKTAGRIHGRDAIILRKANESGYFDVPRRAHLAKIADAVDLSPSTVGTSLRRAVRLAILAHVHGAQRAADLARSSAETPGG